MKNTKAQTGINRMLKLIILIIFISFVSIEKDAILQKNTSVFYELKENDTFYTIKPSLSPDAKIKANLIKNSDFESGVPIFIFL